METTLIAGLVGLLGLAVGRYWDQWSETRRWRRDQRIRSYEQLAGAYYRFREACRSLALLQPGTEDAAAARMHALDVGVEWNRQIIAVWLHASPRVIPALNDLDQSVDDLFFVARVGNYSWEQWRVERAPAEQCLEKFIEAVRQELSLPRLDVTVRSTRDATARGWRSGAS